MQITMSIKHQYKNFTFTVSKGLETLKIQKDDLFKDFQLTTVTTF